MLKDRVEQMFKKMQNFFYRQPDPKNGKWSILVVEDNHVDQKLIADALQRGGFKIFIAANGQEGLALAKTTKPDLIILDCDMPVMNGLEMCRKLREDDSLEHTPVIFLTSNDTPKNIIDCFELDAENYLTKPISAKTLVSQVQASLKEHSSAS